MIAGCHCWLAQQCECESAHERHEERSRCLSATVLCEAMIVGGGNPTAGYRGMLGVKLDLPPNVLALDIIEGGPVWPDGSRKNPRGRASR
jgi:hypothetical protein